MKHPSVDPEWSADFANGSVRGYGVIMKRWSWLAGLVVFIAGAIRAEVASTQPRAAATQADVAGMIEDVRHAEDWLDQVQSFRVKMNAKSTMSMLLVKERVEAERKRDPNVDISGRPDLAPETQSTIEIAFAPQRTRIEVAYVDGPTLTVAWDGRREVSRHVVKGAEDYTIRPQMSGLIDRMMGELQFGRMLPHPYWWVTPERLRHTKATLARPEMYRLEGRGNFHGADCYAVSIGLTNWYIGAADHRYYGRLRYELPTTAAHEAEARILAVARKYGADISHIKEWSAWHDMLPDAKQLEVDTAYEESVRPLCRPREESWCSNYQELGPGRFFPLNQGRSMRNFESETDAELERTEYSVAEIEINPKLDNSMFVIKVPVGASVRDETVSPTRIYRPATTGAGNPR
jgi:hypothetical protein